MTIPCTRTRQLLPFVGFIKRPDKAIRQEKMKSFSKIPVFISIARQKQIHVSFQCYPAHMTWHQHGFALPDRHAVDRSLAFDARVKREAIMQKPAPVFCLDPYERVQSRLVPVARHKTAMLDRGRIHLKLDKPVGHVDVFQHFLHLDRPLSSSRRIDTVIVVQSQRAIRVAGNVVRQNAFANGVQRPGRNVDKPIHRRMQVAKQRIPFSAFAPLRELLSGFGVVAKLDITILGGHPK